MGVLDRFKRTTAEVSEVQAIEGQLTSARHQIETLQERMVDFQREDRGWSNIAEDYRDIVNRDTLNKNAELVRAMSVTNPLMKRGKIIRQGYVFGQGVEITASNDEDETQDIDAAVSAYLDDEGNRSAVFGPQARNAIEGDLFDDGNVFVAHFTNPLNGRVKVRPLPFAEITEIISAPGDAFTPWYYKRVWTESTPSETFGATGLSVERTAYYPDIRYQPLTKPRTLGGHPVMWDAPVYHLRVNPVGRTRTWGVGDGFAAMPWARGYNEFLGDWALLMKALARIAWIMKDKNGKAQQMRSAAQQAAQGGPGQIGYTGSGELEAPSKSGATLDSESGRPLAALAASAMGVAVTILTADPGTTGARAVAETLDTPMRLEMESRQTVHAEFYKASVGYMLEQSVIAPRGPMRGSVDRDEDRLIVTVGTASPTIDVDFPSLEQTDTKTLMEAIAVADGMDLLPELEKLKLVAQALKMDDLASVIEQVTDADGNFIPPSTALGDAAGTAAANRLRQGGNPADVL